MYLMFNINYSEFGYINVYIFFFLLCKFLIEYFFVLFLEFLWEIVCFKMIKICLFLYENILICFFKLIIKYDDVVFWLDVD